MPKRVWWIWLAALLISTALANAAAAWEIKVVHNGWYPARAIEDGVRIEVTGRSFLMKTWYIPIGAHTERMMDQGSTEILRISDNKEWAEIVGYEWVADDVQPTEIGRITIGKNDENKCVVFSGTIWDATFGRC